jgi:23S rRNA pseudouridine2605 synthase
MTTGGKHRSSGGAPRRPGGGKSGGKPGGRPGSGDRHPSGKPKRPRPTAAGRRGDAEPASELPPSRRRDAARSGSDRPARGHDADAAPARGGPDSPPTRGRPVRDRSKGSSSQRTPKAGKNEPKPVPKGPPINTGPMRIQRALARAGISSRRQAEALVTEGRVLVNGQVAVTGMTVNPAKDKITVDGAPLAAPASAEWLVLNKPAGMLTTKADPEGRPTVFDLLPPIAGLTYVGRLDYMTEGVLLLTNDGTAAHQLTHPSNEIERQYVAIVRGNAPAAVKTARRGVMLEDGLVKPTEVEARSLGNRSWEFEVTIAEGRTREIRRLCEALGLEVERLVRVRFGPVVIGKLEPGEMRPLNAKERRTIAALAQGGGRPNLDDIA